MKGIIKISMIQIEIGEFSSTQATRIRYYTTRGTQGPSGDVYASFDHTKRSVEKITAHLEEKGCSVVNIFDNRPQECIVT